MVRAKKRWGQHWLASRGLAEQLVQLMNLPEAAEVVEIGPGTGLLTEAMLSTGARVTAIEVDPERAQDLRDLAAGRNGLEVVEGDFLDTAFEWPAGPAHVVGNLPYNVSGPILGWTCDHSARITSAHYMLQLEVAERVVAESGSRTYGALSVEVQWHFDAVILKRLSPGAFRPPPKVESAFIRLRRRVESPPPANARTTMRAGFAQRRKTLRRALGAAGFDASEVEAALVHLQLRPDARAEALCPDTWLELAARLGEPRS